LPLGDAASLAVHAAATVFDAPSLFVTAHTETASRCSWKGEGNLYRVLDRPSFVDELPQQAKLDSAAAAPQQSWQAVDTGSVFGSSLLERAEMWRLLPESPGYRASPDATDAGAQFDRIAGAQR
jgi:hypothetical protein